MKTRKNKKGIYRKYVFKLTKKGGTRNKPSPREEAAFKGHVERIKKARVYRVTSKKKEVIGRPQTHSQAQDRMEDGSTPGVPIPDNLLLQDLFHIIDAHDLLTQLNNYCNKYYILFSPTKDTKLINYWIQIFCNEEIKIIYLISGFNQQVLYQQSGVISESTTPEQIFLEGAKILHTGEIKTIDRLPLKALIDNEWKIFESDFNAIQQMLPPLDKSYTIFANITYTGTPNNFKEIFESSLTIEDELYSLEKDKSMFSKVLLTNLPPLEILPELNHSREAIPNSDLNSMDCYIASLPDEDRIAKTAIRIKYGIIRSTIDFFHDYVSEAVKIFEDFKAFIKQNNPSIPEEWINTKMDDIESKVTTSGGNVNQTACKNLWSEYSIKYRKELNIPCFPIVDFGNIGSAKIWTDSERTIYTEDFVKIVAKLRELQITHFYIEAQSTPISTALIQHKFGMVTSNIALRDAAPGVSITTAMGLGLENAVWIDRIYDSRYVGLCPQVQQLQPFPDQYRERRLITNGPDCKISKFLGLSEMAVNARLDSKKNEIESRDFSGKSIKVRTSSSYPKINFLSLNGVIQSARDLTRLDIRQLRGQGTASANPDIEIVPGTTDIRNAALLILSLKTYTDYCQADEIEQLKTPTIATSVAHATPGLRVVAASSDFLASRTFSDFFATPSIYVGHNYVTVTCSDTRYETLTSSQIQQRLILYTQLLNNNDLLIRIIISELNKYVTKYTNEQNFTASAPTYYGLSNLLLEMNQNIINIQQIIMDLVEQSTNFQSLSYNEQVNFLKQFPSTLPEFLHSLCKFNIMYDLFKNVNYNFGKIVKKIRSIQTRTENAKFFEIYREIVQEITNALPTKTTSDDLNIHIISLFTYSIATKPDRIKNSFLTNLNLVISELKKKREKSQEQIVIEKILSNIDLSIQFVFRVNQNIQQLFQSKKQLIDAIKTIGNITESSQTQSEDVEKTDIDNKISDSIPGDDVIAKMNLIMEISQHTVILEEEEVDQGETIQLYFPYSELLLICQNIYTPSTLPIKEEDIVKHIFTDLYPRLLRRGGRKTKKMIKNKRKTKKFYKKTK